MSVNSSKDSDVKSTPKRRTFRHWVTVVFRVLGLTSWVLLSFIAAQLIVGFGWSGLSTAIPHLGSMGDSVVQFVLTALIYVLTLAIVVGGAFLFKQRVSAAELGVDKHLRWLDLGLAPAAFIGYLIVSTIVMMVITQTIPGFDVQQAQEIGFDNIVSRVDLLMAFLALVVFAPVAEEILFRGYLYGKLRGITGAVVASVLVSALFGLVHMQWNVAVDTFILSMVMCGLRELTGSIWAGTLVHMIKNGLAFFLLFILPVLGV